MIRVAVLGAGRIGKIHAAQCRAQSPTASSSPSPIRWRGREPISPTALGARSVDRCQRAAIARQDVDAVVIGTPTDTHVDLL